MPQRKIVNVVVIGAGTMGAGIAAHFANAGYDVVLLDIVPSELTEQEKASRLSLESPAVRNRIVNGGWQRCQTSLPPSLFAPSVASRLRLGNLEDDFNSVACADWIIEALIERLDIKQDLMRRIDQVRKPEAIVSTNTSGIPIHQIAEGCSKRFQQHFLGTHFFNPPRYIKLVELIPHEMNDPELIEFVRDFCTRRLGKGVVVCKDTPNFIANRVVSLSSYFGMNYALDQGYTIPEVDALTGPAIGRPKTGTFRLNDLIGADVRLLIARSLYENIPHDPARAALQHPKTIAVFEDLVMRGLLGNKSGAGFYKKITIDGRKEFWVLNMETFEYEAPKDPDFEVLDSAGTIKPTAERIAFLAYAEDRAGEYIWHLLSRTVAYAASLVPEISEGILAIDQACKWGYVWELGPFEIWDALGVARSIGRMREEGVTIPDWVERMLEAGCPSFYQSRAGMLTGYYDPETQGYLPLPVDNNVISIAALKAAGKEIQANKGASLIDMGDGILLLEFHAPANALNPKIREMTEKALDELSADRWQAMVIGSQGKHFCAGADLQEIVGMAARGDFEALDNDVRQLQQLFQRIRYSSKPVVAAVYGMVLGGGCELMMSAARVVASAEVSIGLVEANVGLLPAGTGVTEMVRRLINPVMVTALADDLPHARHIFEWISRGKVAVSALQGRQAGFLRADDVLVMNPDYLLGEAKQAARHLGAVYQAPSPGLVWAGGRDMLAALKIGAWGLTEGGWASEHDLLIAAHTAFVLTGGDLSAAGWVAEEHLLGLERREFVRLAKTKKTQERIEHMLKHRQPLKN